MPSVNIDPQKEQPKGTTMPSPQQGSPNPFNWNIPPMPRAMALPYMGLLGEAGALDMRHRQAMELLKLGKPEWWAPLLQGGGLALGLAGGRGLDSLINAGVSGVKGLFGNNNSNPFTPSTASSNLSNDTIVPGDISTVPNLSGDDQSNLIPSIVEMIQGWGDPGGVS